MPNYPPEFVELCKDPTLRAAFVSEIKPIHPRDCKNCGGVGTLVIFLAVNGPFPDPPGPPAVIKFVNGNWWSGKSLEATCPVCGGNGIDPSYIQPPIHSREQQLELSGVVKKVEKRDYTDY